VPPSQTGVEKLWPVIASNLPFGSGGLDRIASPAHLPHVSTLSRPGTRPGIRPVIRDGRRRAGHAVPLSRCLSAAGIRFLGILSRQQSSAPLTIGLPRWPARTLARFPCSARMRHGWAGCPLCPGDDGADTAIGLFLAVACRLSTAGPCHPGVTTRPGMSSITGHQRGFSGIHPSQPSPHLWPPDGTRALGLPPGLRTPPGRTRRRTPGRGRASALPEVTSSASLTSSDALTHPRAASRRTTP
jgi:hypothetical protein